MLARVAGGNGSTPVSPAVVVARLDRELRPEVTAGHTFSLLYGTLALDTGEFRFVSAGHPVPIHLGKKAAPIRLEVSGFPVGVGNGSHREHVVTLAPGDRMLLYSDGLTGVRNADGEHFGTQRLLAALEESRRFPLGEALGALARAVEGWRREEPRHDDLSALMVERTEGNEPRPR